MLFEKIDNIVGGIDRANAKLDRDTATEMKATLLDILRDCADDEDLGGLSIDILLSQEARERRKQAKQWKSWEETQ